MASGGVKNPAEAGVGAGVRWDGSGLVARRVLVCVCFYSIAAMPPMTAEAIMTIWIAMIITMTK